MSRMRVEHELCTLCGECMEVCPFEGITMEGGQVEFTDACRLCRVCIKACPTGAIWLEQSDAGPILERDKYKDVLIFAEQRQGRIQPVTYELIGKGLELARCLGQEVIVFLAGRDLKAQAHELLLYGVSRVYLYEHKALEHFRIEPYTSLIVDLVNDTLPNILLMGATPVGRSLAPRVAARLRTGLTADCTSLSVKENGDLVQTRPAFGGDVMAQIITPRHRPQMATVRHKVMASAPRLAEPKGEVKECAVDESKLKSGIAVLKFEPYQITTSISDAEIVVAGGRGVGRPEGLKLLEQLAVEVGGALGVTRPLVEQGWADYTMQIGMSGRTIRPRLYIGCGISGAIQHVAGMRGAEAIFAINSDPNAPIFDIAHYGLVGDMYEIVPHLIAMIREGDDPNGVFQLS
ncbi:MAG: electron transfer flavoprotein subunit alpha [Firmicutes bacterium]|nr:electron transfer flavoprotein subunit alpha [Bacillota bacterium]